MNDPPNLRHWHKQPPPDLHTGNGSRVAISPPAPPRAPGQPLRLIHSEQLGFDNSWSHTTHLFPLRFPKYRDALRFAWSGQQWKRNVLQIIIISCNVFTAMANSAKPRRRNSTSEVVPWIPVARTGLFPSQGHDGPRPQLSFVLKVLAGDDCGVTQMHLGFRPVWRVQEQAGDARALFAVSQCEVLVRNSMIAMMRRLADLWIDSGKSGPNRECDNPSDRNSLYSPPLILTGGSLRRRALQIFSTDCWAMKHSGLESILTAHSR